MKALLAFTKKELMELIRSGRLTILLIIFILFGIMNPAFAKMTPWMMEIMADSLEDTGLVVAEVSVDAMTSWTQFFKNIPMGLIAFILIHSGIFSKEYQSGTLVLVLTKGLSRYKVIMAKAGVMMLLWTVCYWLCYGITYGYNEYFWDNSIAHNLVAAAVNWWLFGLCILAFMVLFSVLTGSSTGVLMGTGGTALAAYLIGLFPKVGEYSPAMLMNTASLLTGAEAIGLYRKAICIAVLLIIVCMGVSIPVMNRKRI